MNFETKTPADYGKMTMISETGERSAVCITNAECTGYGCEGNIF